MEFSCEFVENQYFAPTIHQSLQINVSQYYPGENLAPASPSLSTLMHGEKNGKNLPK